MFDEICETLSRLPPSHTISKFERHMWLFPFLESQFYLESDSNLKCIEKKYC